VGDGRRVDLVRDPAILVIIPDRELIFAIVKAEQIAGGTVFKAVGFDWGAGAGEKSLIGQPTGGVVIELRGVGDLIRIVGQPAGGVEKLLDTAVRPGARAQPV